MIEQRDKGFSIKIALTKKSADTEKLHYFFLTHDPVKDEFDIPRMYTLSGFKPPHIL